MHRQYTREGEGKRKAKNAGSARRTPEVDPKSTKPGKRAPWTIVFFAPSPPAPPSSVPNKMDGLPSFFRVQKERGFCCPNLDSKLLWIACPVG